MAKNVKIGCRGAQTQVFLRGLGFKEENTFLTGCPSLQLIKPASIDLSKEYSRILVTGSLIARIDLIESLALPIAKILFIPQTLDSYKVGLIQKNQDSRIEIFTPVSYRSWINKIRKWMPEISLGSRLHGNLAALSLGIPAIFMSGDIRTREVTHLARLPFFDDLRDLKPASDTEKLSDSGIDAEILLNFSEEIRHCIGNFVIY